MYEVLTGLPPHIGENLLATLQKHIADPVTPLRRAREGTDIPEQLYNIVLKALEKEPGDRFQSALELKQALEQVKLALDSRRLTLPLPGQEPFMPSNYSQSYPSANTTGQSYAPADWSSQQYEPTGQDFAITNPPGTGNRPSDQFGAIDQSTSQGARPQSQAGPGGSLKQSFIQEAAPDTSTIGPDTAQLNTLPITTVEKVSSNVTAKLGSNRRRLLSMICIGAVLGGLGAWFAYTKLRPAAVTSQSASTAGDNLTGDDKLWNELQLAGQEAFNGGKYNEAETKFLAATQLGE